MYNVRARRARENIGRIQWVITRHEQGMSHRVRDTQTLTYAQDEIPDYGKQIETTLAGKVTSGHDCHFATSVLGCAHESRFTPRGTSYHLYLTSSIVP